MKEVSPEEKAKHLEQRRQQAVRLARAVPEALEGATVPAEALRGFCLMLEALLEDTHAQ